MSDRIFLRKEAIQQRMNCDGRVAYRIMQAFVTVEQLVEACESDDPLQIHDGVGPKTAEVIEEWWEKRFEREQQADETVVTERNTRSATIAILGSWEDALDGDTDE